MQGKEISSLLAKSLEHISVLGCWLWSFHLGQKCFVTHVAILVVSMSGFLSKATGTVSNKPSSMRQPEIGSLKRNCRYFFMMALNQSQEESIQACHIMSMSLLHFDINDELSRTACSAKWSTRNLAKRAMSVANHPTDPYPRPTSCKL